MSVQRLLLPIFLWVLPLALVLTSYFRFTSGVPVEKAWPVFMDMDDKLSVDTYSTAAKQLLQAQDTDGDQYVAAGEALLRAGGNRVRAAAAAQRGLTNSPASARGWIVYAAAVQDQNRPAAAAAVGMDFELFQYDYWFAGTRTILAALLWPELSARTRQSALIQARQLWLKERMRPALRSVVLRPDGMRLVDRAFADRPAEIAAIKQWAGSPSFKNSGP